MRFRIDLNQIVAAIPGIKLEMAQATKEHVKNKIRVGMRPLIKKKPRRLGLFDTGNDARNETPGAHLFSTINYTTSKTGFSVGSNFVGARRLHYGGGGIPPRPYARVGRALKAKWQEIWASHSAT